MKYEMKFLFFTFLPFYLFTTLYASDMKVKLNSKDGSTGFQIRDSDEIVVSSITSNGNVHSKYGVVSATGVFTGTGLGVFSITTSSGIKMNAGTLDIPTGAIKDGTITTDDIGDRQVSSAKMLMYSTFTYNSSSDSTTDNTNWKKIPGMEANFDVTAQPAMIIVNFSAETWRSEDNNWMGGQFRIMLNDTTMIGFNEIVVGVNVSNSSRWPISISTGYRVTSTGNYKVTVEYKLPSGWTGATLNVANASLNGFWLGSP